MFNLPFAKVLKFCELAKMDSVCTMNNGLR